MGQDHAFPRPVAWDPGTILTSRRTLDLDQPLGVLMARVAHFAPDDADPLGLIGRFER